MKFLAFVCCYMFLHTPCLYAYGENQEVIGKFRCSRSVTPFDKLSFRGPPGVKLIEFSRFHIEVCPLFQESKGNVKIQAIDTFLASGTCALERPSSCGKGFSFWIPKEGCKFCIRLFGDLSIVSVPQSEKREDVYKKKKVFLSELIQDIPCPEKVKRLTVVFYGASVENSLRSQGINWKMDAKIRFYPD